MKDVIVIYRTLSKFHMEWELHQLLHSWDVYLPRKAAIVIQHSVFKTNVRLITIPREWVYSLEKCSVLLFLVTLQKQPTEMTKIKYEILKCFLFTRRTYSMLISAYQIQYMEHKELKY
jgi:hypothetical protein